MVDPVTSATLPERSRSIGVCSLAVSAAVPAPSQLASFFLSRFNRLITENSRMRLRSGGRTIVSRCCASSIATARHTVPGAWPSDGLGSDRGEADVGAEALARLRRGGAGALLRRLRRRSCGARFGMHDGATKRLHRHVERAQPRRQDAAGQRFAWPPPSSPACAAAPGQPSPSTARRCRRSGRRARRAAAPPRCRARAWRSPRRRTWRRCAP